MSAKISVLLADDHAVVRETLAQWLATESDMAVVGTVGNGEDAVAESARLEPDVAVLDVDMPGVLAFEAAARIAAEVPRTRILFLSGFTHDRYIEQALAVKASGYVSKSEPPASIAAAIRAVASGRAYFSPDVADRIVVGPSGVELAASQSRAATLTRRELTCLQYLARGLSKKEVARAMSLSERTVNTHTASLMAKLDIHNRVELTRFAIREGLVEA